MVCTENLPVPPVLGGAIQTYISGSLPYLSKKHDITVIGVNAPSLPDEETIDGVHYIRVPGKVLELYREGVVQYVQANQFDLIHIFNRPRLVLPIRKVAPNSKITLSMHNDMFNIGKIDVEEAKLVLEEVSNIVTVSDYVGNVIKELYPQSANKIRTIYSGVDSDRFLPGNDSRMVNTRNTLRKEFGLENKTVILFAGRLSENKGVDRLIRALPQLSNTFKDLALVIVGSNWFSQNNVTDYVAYVRAIAKKQDVPVITTGFVSPFEIHNWFAVADIFVCTSLWQEPLARVHYEAMAAGLPIVTTARGGNPEVIIPGENGFIVENPEDPSEFAAKITEILSNKSLMNNMGRKGRELAVSKYLWSRVADEILSVWQRTEFNSSISSEQLEEIALNSPLKFAVPMPQTEEKGISNDVLVEKVVIPEEKPQVEDKLDQLETLTQAFAQAQTQAQTMEEALVEKAKLTPSERVAIKVEELSSRTRTAGLRRIRRVTDTAETNRIVNRISHSETSNMANTSYVSNSNFEPMKLGRIISLMDAYRKQA